MCFSDGRRGRSPEAGPAAFAGGASYHNEALSPAHHELTLAAGAVTKGGPAGLRPGPGGWRRRGTQGAAVFPDRLDDAGASGAPGA
jgi:hypothetical protein